MICLFAGNHPVLTLAEARRQWLSPSAKVQVIADHLIYVDVDHVPLQRLHQSGSLIKLGEVIRTGLPTIGDLQPAIEAWLADSSEHKVNFALSSTDDSLDLQQIAQAAKRNVREKKLRFLVSEPGQTSNAARIVHNDLLAPGNHDLTIVSHGTGYDLIRSLWVQDIDAYRARDEGRPHRSDEQGMMPIKLCQTLIQLGSPENAPDSPPVLLDPFCGDGSILQEAWLMGFEVMGSDISQDAVHKAQANLDWLATKFRLKQTAEPTLFSYDARRIGEALLPEMLDRVVSEGYLGELFTENPSPQTIEAQNRKLGPLYRESLTALYPLLKPGGTIVITLPYYRETALSLWAQVLDDVLGIGYHQKSILSSDGEQFGFSEDEIDTYIYSRPDQIIGREIVLLQK